MKRTQICLNGMKISSSPNHAQIVTQIVTQILLKRPKSRDQILHSQISLKSGLNYAIWATFINPNLRYLGRDLGFGPTVNAPLLAPYIHILKSNLTCVSRPTPKCSRVTVSMFLHHQSCFPFTNNIIQCLIRIPLESIALTIELAGYRVREPCQ